MPWVRRHPIMLTDCQWAEANLDSPLLTIPMKPREIQGVHSHWLFYQPQKSGSGRHCHVVTLYFII